MTACCESLLAFGVSFIYSVLENPGIWQSDLLALDNPGQLEEQKSESNGMTAEKFCEEVVFTKEKTHQIFLALTRKYLVYTEEEIETWKQDSLKFFLDAKNESNERKGNYLREKALRLIAAVQLRLDPQFEAFCTFVMQELLACAPASNLPIEAQVQKDAMLQILHQRLSNETGIETAGLLSMIEAELQQTK